MIHDGLPTVSRQISKTAAVGDGTESQLDFVDPPAYVVCSAVFNGCFDGCFWFENSKEASDPLIWGGDEKVELTSMNISDMVSVVSLCYSGVS